MNKDRKLIIAGNWKMNKTVSEAADLVNGLLIDLKDIHEIDMVVCPPFTSLSEVSGLVLSTNVRLGAQNMSQHASGAYTGEISAGMLRDFSVKYVILGHSERRQYFNETDALVSVKAQAAHAAALRPIICVGETLEERESGVTEKVIETQIRGSLDGIDASKMADTVIAYEPVWAIGTGKTATSDQAQEVHAFIRKLLVSIYDESTAKVTRIQYGGSVKPNNARELMSQPDIDGALVGGASLEARSFTEIIKTCLD